MYVLKCIVCERSWPDKTELCICGNSILIPEEISCEYKTAEIRRAERRIKENKMKIYKKSIRENKYF